MSPALAFGLVIAIGQLLPVRLPGGRPVVPLAGAAATGYALLFDINGKPLAQPFSDVAIAVCGGYLSGAVIATLLGRAPRRVLLVRRMTVAVLAGAVFRLAAPERVFSTSYADLRPELSRTALLVIGVAALAAAADVLFGVAEGAIRRRLRSLAGLLGLLLDELRATVGLNAAVAATAVLFALGTPVMGLYAIPTFAVPLLLTQFAFRRFAAVRTTYRQTIRALAQVTEVSGYVARGHGRRVTALAVEMARELGLPESQLVDLEYAALLHDIGQLSLTEPIPAGSTLVVPPAERQRVAALGADVIKTTGVLDRVAAIVARQADPYRRHREPPDPTLPIESRIIKAASAFDDVVTGLSRNRGACDGTGGTPAADDIKAIDPELAADAMERLRLGMAYEYDPRVVDALHAVLARHGIQIASRVSSPRAATR